tara:strand:+ start:31652 stop:32608 length:957 start_codon:yes stop_codon:yes gene_type:complete
VSIDVIITCYNEGDFIGEAVQSVLAQSRSDLIQKIIIADDGSDSKTINQLKKVSEADERIEVLFGGGGAGVSAQRLNALRCSDADYFAILDGDDYWVEDKIETQFSIIVDHPETDLIYSRYISFPDGHPEDGELASVIDISHSKNLEKEYFISDPPIIPSTTLIKRATYDACGGFADDLKVFEDTELFIRLCAIGRVRFQEQPTLYKRYHPNSITGGVKDLMADHANVAFRAASRNPELLPLVPRRLSERARKLGNLKFVVGDRAAAVAFLRLAVQLNPLSISAWSGLVGVQFAPGLLEKVLGSKLKAKRHAFGYECN